MNATTRRVKLCETDGSQAVRLPAEFRFDADEVFIRRDRTTGDVILSMRPRGEWRDYIRVREQLGVAPPAFPDDRTGSASEDRDPFTDWRE